MNSQLWMFYRLHLHVIPVQNPLANRRMANAVQQLNAIHDCMRRVKVRSTFPMHCPDSSEPMSGQCIGKVDGIGALQLPVVYLQEE